MIGYILKLLASLMMAGALCAQTGGYQPDIKKTPEGIAYLSTGVGYDSRINLPRFLLRLLFSAKTGKYLAEIDVEIKIAPNKTTKIHSLGPWLDIDLPPGKYTIKARTAKGQEVTRSFVLNKGRVTAIKLVWDISDEEI